MSLSDTTQRIAALVGAEGVAVGVDAAPRFIETAIAEAEEAGVANARFLVADVQASPIEGPFDRAFSRMGTMFFANPVAALRNVRRALGPGGRLAMVVWRRREDNDWLYRAQTIVEGIVSRPEEVRRAHCGPGPFSMAATAWWRGRPRRSSPRPPRAGRSQPEMRGAAISIGAASSKRVLK